MAKASVILRTAKRDADGRHPLWLRLTDTHGTAFVSLRVWIAAKHWNPESTTRPVRKSHPEADEMNELVLGKLAAAESARVALIKAGRHDTPQAIKDVLTAKPQTSDPDFLAYVDAFLAGIETANPARVDKERACFAKLRAHLAGVAVGLDARKLTPQARAAGEKKAAAVRLPVSRLTPALLRAFTDYLTAPPPAGLGNKASTADTNLRTIRLHVRRAVVDGLLPRDANPFDGFPMPRAVRAERTRLTLADVARLDALDLGPRGPAGSLPSRVRDVFLFALFAAGVRFGDLARLRVRDVYPPPSGTASAGWRLRYVAGKTSKPTETPLVPAAVRVVQPYLLRLDGTPKDAGDYLFPLVVAPSGTTTGGRRTAGHDLAMARGMLKAVSSANVLTNTTLGRVAALAGLVGPDGEPAHLTMHAARHSFADLARRGGWSAYDISKALRHSSIGTTEGYLAAFEPDALDAPIHALFGDDGQDSRDAPHDGGTLDA